MRFPPCSSDIIFSMLLLFVILYASAISFARILTSQKRIGEIWTRVARVPCRRYLQPTCLPIIKESKPGFEPETARWKWNALSCSCSCFSTSSSHNLLRHFWTVFHWQNNPSTIPEIFSLILLSVKNLTFQTKHSNTNGHVLVVFFRIYFVWTFDKELYP